MKAVPSKLCSSSISTEVNERMPTPSVTFSRPQAAKSSLEEPSVVSLAAFAAKQQSSIIKTWGLAVSSMGGMLNQSSDGVVAKLFLYSSSMAEIEERSAGFLRLTRAKYCDLV